MAAVRSVVGPLRVLPVTIVAAGLLLGLRVTELWTDFNLSVGSEAEAQVSLESLIVPAGGGEAGGGEAEEAHGAEDVQAEPEEHAAPEEHGTADAGGTEAQDDALPLPDLLGTAAFTVAEVEVLTELAKRRGDLDGRERELGLREGLLQAAERRLDEKIVELQALRSDIEALVQQQDEQEEAELQSLVKIYETMKPKDAARILQELEMQVLLPIMERMKERSTAPVLAAMDSDRARELTAELSRRRDLGLSNG